MKELEKIDIIGLDIHCYTLDGSYLKLVNMASEFNDFTSLFSDTEDLLTINITDPIPRLIKFYEIKDSIPEEVILLNYSDMTEEQKLTWDSFVTSIKSK